MKGAQLSTAPHGPLGTAGPAHTGLTPGAAPRGRRDTPGTLPELRAPEPARPRPRGSSCAPHPALGPRGRAGGVLLAPPSPSSPCHCAASAAPPAPRSAPASARPSRRPPGAVREFGQSAPPPPGGPSPPAPAPAPRPRAHLRVRERGLLRV